MYVRSWLDGNINTTYVDRSSHYRVVKRTCIDVFIVSPVRKWEQSSRSRLRYSRNPVLYSSKLSDEVVSYVVVWLTALDGDQDFDCPDLCEDRVYFRRCDLDL